jgi:hypothetical protein
MCLEAFTQMLALLSWLMRSGLYAAHGPQWLGRDVKFVVAMPGGVRAPRHVTLLLQVRASPLKVFFQHQRTNQSIVCKTMYL